MFFKINVDFYSSLDSELNSICDQVNKNLFKSSLINLNKNELQALANINDEFHILEIALYFKKIINFFNDFFHRIVTKLNFKSLSLELMNIKYIIYIWKVESARDLNCFNISKHSFKIILQIFWFNVRLLKKINKSSLSKFSIWNNSV